MLRAGCIRGSSYHLRFVVQAGGRRRSCARKVQANGLGIDNYESVGYVICGCVCSSDFLKIVHLVSSRRTRSRHIDRRKLSLAVARKTVSNSGGVVIDSDGVAPVIYTA